MDGKFLRKAAASDVKKYFWIFFGAILLINIITGLCNNVFGAVGSLANLLTAARNGMLSEEQFADTTSPIYAMLTASPSVFTGLLNLLAFPLTIFVLNPMNVGLNKLFTDGIKDKPKLETLFTPFKNHYMNIVTTMLISTVFLTFITFALAFVYMMVVFAAMIPVALISGANAELETPLIIFMLVVFIAATVAYIAVSICISYNFAFIPYILTDHPECKFSQAYEANKQMVKNKKRRIFKAEFVYYFLEAMALLIPAVLVCVGVIFAMNNSGSIEILALGILTIVPAVFVSMFINVYKNALWAHMYKALEIPLPEISQNPVYQAQNNSGTYSPPTFRSSVSYVAKEENKEENADEINEEKNENDEMNDDETL